MMILRITSVLLIALSFSVNAQKTQVVNIDKQNKGKNQTLQPNNVIVAPVNLVPFNGNISTSNKSVVTNGTTPSLENNVVLPSVVVVPASQVTTPSPKSIVIDNGNTSSSVKTSSNNVELPVVNVVKYKGQKSKKSIELQ